MNSRLAIEWQPLNDTGILVLDEQHRGMVSIINSLAFSIKHHNVEFIINNTFIMVDSYIKMHFATEEELMRASGYSGLEDHKKIHGAFINESFSIANKSLRTHNIDIYMQFLKKWWMEHINGHDRLYIGSIKQYMAEYHAP